MGLLDTRSLLDGMKGQIASALAEKAGINLGQAEQAVHLAGDSIKEGIMEIIYSFIFKKLKC